MASSRHILVYGPPGVGKLTVARHLVDRFEVRLLDNHVTLDLADRLFAPRSPEHTDLTKRLRRVMFEAAADAGVDVVSTLVYAKGTDDAYVAELEAAATAAGATVSRVLLTADVGVLEQRLGDDSRVGTGKLTDVATLRRLLDRHELSTPYHADDLEIDTTNLRVGTIADRIATRFALDRSHVEH